MNGNEIKLLTDISNEGNHQEIFPFKKQKTFGFQDVQSDISDSSFQLRKRTESRASHFSPVGFRNSMEENVNFILLFSGHLNIPLI